jgi:hypothetical protein
VDAFVFPILEKWLVKASIICAVAHNMSIMSLAKYEYESQTIRCTLNRKKAAKMFCLGSVLEDD